jgi:hypothetical protein
VEEPKAAEDAGKEEEKEEKRDAKKQKREPKGSAKKQAQKAAADANGKDEAVKEGKEGDAPEEAKDGDVEMKEAPEVYDCSSLAFCLSYISLWVRQMHECEIKGVCSREACVCVEMCTHVRVGAQCV